jgi:hypothetical protein
MVPQNVFRLIVTSKTSVWYSAKVDQLLNVTISSQEERRDTTDFVLQIIKKTLLEISAPYRIDYVKK